MYYMIIQFSIFFNKKHIVNTSNISKNSAPNGALLSALTGMRISLLIVGQS